MDYLVFDHNRRTYGACASWAVWSLGAPERARFTPDPVSAPRFHLNRAVKDLGAVASQSDLEVAGRDLNPNVVLVALNFAERAPASQQAVEGMAFHSFHEETTSTSDHRLRDACCGTPLWGAYLTDLVKFDGGKLKPLRNSDASAVRKMLADPSFRRQQVEGLSQELIDLEVDSPTIVALGSDAHWALDNSDSREMLSRRLGEGTKLLKLTHYSKAAGIRHSDYVRRISQELVRQKFFWKEA